MGCNCNARNTFKEAVYARMLAAKKAKEDNKEKSTGRKKKNEKGLE